MTDPDDIIDDLVGELSDAKAEIERLRKALQQCVHVVQSEIEYCKDHTTAWFKLCVATREKALAALGEGKE